MKLIQLLLISTFLLQSINIYSTENYYRDRYVDLTYSVESLAEVTKLSNQIKIYADYFSELFNYTNFEPISITILPTVWDLTSTFNVSSKIGAVWVDNTSFFQPLKTLNLKGKYYKTIFTEYSHFFITNYTHDNCPNWLKEGVSYYLWLEYSGDTMIEGNRILDDEYLKDFSSYMRDENKLKDFYYNFILFMNKRVHSHNDLVKLLNEYKNYE